MRRLRLLALALGLPFSLHLAACGDSGGDGGNGNGSNGGGDPTFGQTRFVHLSSRFSSNELDVYRDADVQEEGAAANPLATRLRYGAASDSVAVRSGSNTFLYVFAGGDPTDSNDVQFRPSGLVITEDGDSDATNNLVNLFIDGAAADQARAVVDDLEAPAAGGRFRFFHYSANLSSRSITIYDARDNRNPTPLESGISFGNASANDVDLPAGQVILGIGDSSGPDKTFTFNVIGGASKAFIVSSGSEEQLFLMDANGAILPAIVSEEFVPPGEGQINFVHLADGAGPVDIYVQDEELPEVLNLQENASSGVRTRTEGAYTFIVVESGDDVNQSVVELEDFNLAQDQRVTILIYDDPDGELVMEAMPNEATSPINAGETRFRISHLAPDLAEVRILNGAEDPPAEIDPSFDEVGFGDTTDYVVQAEGQIVLWFDADDDPREDPEVEITIPANLAASMVTFNILVDSQERDGEPRYRAVISPQGGGTTTIEGVTIPDPSFVRPIHLGTGYGSGAASATDFYVDFELERQNIELFRTNSVTDEDPPVSQSGYIQVEAGAPDIGFVVGNGNLINGVRDFGTLEKLENQTAVLHGFGCPDSCDITVTTDETSATANIPGGNVRVRFFHALANTGQVTIRDLDVPGIEATLQQRGAVSDPYQTMPIDPDPGMAGTQDHVFRVTTLTQTLEFVVPAQSWTERKVYTIYLVNNVPDEQFVLILQDEDGNTSEVRRRGDIRAFTLLTNDQAQPAPQSLSVNTSAGATLFTWPDVLFGELTAPTEFVEETYRVTFDVQGFGPTECNGVRVRAEQVTTVIATGIANAGMGTQCFSVEPNESAPPAGEIAWRLLHGATFFGNQDPLFQTEFDLFDFSSDPATVTQRVAFGGSAPGGLNQFREVTNDGFDLGLDTNQDGTEDIIFSIPVLTDRSSYTFVLARQDFVQPQRNPPVVLYVIDDETQDVQVIGPNVDVVAFNLSPDAGPVDLFVNGLTPAEIENLPYPQNSSIVTIEGGTTTFDVASAGDDIADSFLTFSGPVTGGARHTVAVYGRDTERKGVILANPVVNIMPDTLRLRVVHTLGGVGPVDVYDVSVIDNPNKINGMFAVQEGGVTGYETFDVGAPVRIGIDVLSTNNPTLTRPSIDYFVELAGLAPDRQYNLMFAFDDRTNELSALVEASAEPGPQISTLQATGRVRIVNVSAVDNAIDMQVDGIPTTLNAIANGTSSDWYPVSPGTYDFSAVVSPAGQLRATVTASISSAESYTLAFQGFGGTPSDQASITVLNDDFVQIQDTRFQFIHALESAGRVDVVDLRGAPPLPKIFEDVAAGTAATEIFELSSTMDVPLGLDLLDTAPGGTPENAITLPAILFDPGMHVNIVVFANSMGMSAAVGIRADGTAVTLPLN